MNSFDQFVFSALRWLSCTPKVLLCQFPLVCNCLLGACKTHWRNSAPTVEEKFGCPTWIVNHHLVQPPLWFLSISPLHLSTLWRLRNSFSNLPSIFRLLIVRCKVGRERNNRGGCTKWWFQSMWDIQIFLQPSVPSFFNVSYMRPSDNWKLREIRTRALLVCKRASEEQRKQVVQMNSFYEEWYSLLSRNASKITHHRKISHIPSTITSHSSLGPCGDRRGRFVPFQPFFVYLSFNWREVCKTFFLRGSRVIPK